MRFTSKLMMTLAFGALFAFCGCAKVDSSSQSESHVDVDDHDADGEHGHAKTGHAKTGPHGGHIIDLGRNHEYHAELVEAHENHSTAIHILDGDLKPLAVEAATISMSVKTDSGSPPYELAAKEAADGGGSIFESTDQDLFHALEDEGEPTVRVQIKGTPFKGTLTHHEHDHEEHDHEEHDHEGHDHEEHDQ